MVEAVLVLVVVVAVCSPAVVIVVVIDVDGLEVLVAESVALEAEEGPTVLFPGVAVAPCGFSAVEVDEEWLV